MKQVISVLIIGILLVGGLTACGKKGAPVYQKKSEQTKSSG
ncbi:hypothetical protein [Sneathiella limimaris]|nr:hypothetical protein [Sneathiella limimaris]